MSNIINSTLYDAKDYEFYIKCDIHGKVKTTFRKLNRNKYPCVFCANEATGNSKIIKYEEVKKRAEEKGYLLLSTKYHS